MFVLADVHERKHARRDQTSTGDTVGQGSLGVAGKRKRIIIWQTQQSLSPAKRLRLRYQECKDSFSPGIRAQSL